jgi:hypothetical protein
MYEIDYETMFRKSFLPVFESMFQVKKWLGEKEHLQITKSSMLDEFFM